MDVLFTDHSTADAAVEPAWDVAKLFPEQGQWSEPEYFSLNGNRLVESTQGFIEVLARPTVAHQRLVRFLTGLLLAFAGDPPVGEFLFAPTRVRLWSGKFREPDVLFMRKEHAARICNDY